MFLWSLFSDIYQVLGGPARFATCLLSDAALLSDVRRIVEGSSPADPDGSFWHYPHGRVALDDAVNSELGDVLKTLRNGFAHSHWYLADLSAVEYWRELGWDVEGADPEFNLTGRPSKNFMMYVADADIRRGTWNSAEFWAQNDLRILVTPSHVLRYHLHLMLNYILNGSRSDVFQD